MHMQNRHCNNLIETTAAALNEDAVTLMLLAVQRDNLQLSVKSALNRQVFQLNWQQDQQSQQTLQGLCWV
jgi:hypothetical protein